MEKCCSIERCGSILYRRGYCVKHYMRFKRHGDPEKITRKSPGTVTEEDKKRQKREEYHRNKDKYIARAERWRAQNHEKYKENKIDYFSRDEIKLAARARTKDWVSRNKNKKRDYDREWVKNNRAISNSYKAKRRAKERQATPPWLSDAHFAAIKAIYIEAERLSKETGIPHQVDHIVPLSGKTVSGLHVPWNLRAIPAPENNRRPRIWDHNTQI